MTVFLGKTDYSAYKGFAAIEADFRNVSGTISAQEICIKKHSGDDGYVIFMAADKITGMWKPETLKAGTLCYWHIHSKQYTRWTKENSKTPTEPSPLELTWIKFLESEEGKKLLDIPQTGNINLGISEKILDFVTQNKEWVLLAELQSIPELKLLKDIPEASGTSGGKKGGSSHSQKEGEKLTDRFNFLKTILGSYGEGCEDIVSLTASYKSFMDEIEQSKPGLSKTAETLLDYIFSNRPNK